jgi:hypothetical protein
LSTYKRVKVDAYLAPSAKSIPQVAQRAKARTKTIKLGGKYMCKPWTRQWLPKLKRNELEFIKIKNFCASKDIIM